MSPVLSVDTESEMFAPPDSSPDLDLGEKIITAWINYFSVHWKRDKLIKELAPIAPLMADLMSVVATPDMNSAFSCELDIPTSWC